VNNGTVSKNGLTVAIPTTSTGPQGPTGQVVNGTASFVVNGAPARFIFANLNGTISAWNPSLGTTASIVATGTPAVYTALALAGTNLYAVNAVLGSIDVYDGSFANITGSFAGKFVNPDLPAGLEPFNVQNIGGNLYVTYAPAGRPAQIAADTGEGAVAVFDAAGNFIKQIVAGSQLAAPWGGALAPADFGLFGGDLLVGNFSFEHSEINAFDPVTGLWQGVIPVKTGTEDPGGLWALSFGIGGNNGDPRTLYVTDGINGERNGLFAAIAPVPEPGTLLMVIAGVLGLLSMRKRRPVPARSPARN
jgi:uncharacterized protein (TIGR03118 family)